MMVKTIFRYRSSQIGFTLIELMVVLVIMGILAAIIGPRLVGHTDKASQVQARAQIENFKTALKLYYLNHKAYPTTEQGLAALVTAPSSGAGLSNYPERGYLDGKTVPKDPWGNQYIYLSPGIYSEFDIVSYGADGVQGGEGKNMDITSWETDE
jgi:general secretion pathway protein G